MRWRFTQPVFLLQRPPSAVCYERHYSVLPHCNFAQQCHDAQTAKGMHGAIHVQHASHVPTFKLMLQLRAYLVGRRCARTYSPLCVCLAAGRLPLLKRFSVSPCKVTQPPSSRDTLLSFKYLQHLQRYPVSARPPVISGALCLYCDVGGACSVCESGVHAFSSPSLSSSYRRHIDKPAI